jgi:hypothetical protein
VGRDERTVNDRGYFQSDGRRRVIESEVEEHFRRTVVVESRGAELPADCPDRVLGDDLRD